MEQNPSFELDWMFDRQKSLDKARDKLKAEEAHMLTNPNASSAVNNPAGSQQALIPERK